MKNIIFLGCILVFAFSCKNQEPTESAADEFNSVQEEAYVSKIGVRLTGNAKKDLEQWEKYQLIDARINPYYKTTKSEALLGAEELAVLILDASDTIDVKKLDRADIKIRFNVLYNHAFRLQDMNTISSITNEEVKMEVVALLEAYSALNDKINTVYKIEQYKKEYDQYKSDTLQFFDESELTVELKDDTPPNSRKVDAKTKKVNDKNKKINQQGVKSRE